MRVGFTGTQRGMTERQKAAFLTLLMQLKVTELVHGDCVGSDSDAHDLCLGLGVQLFLRPCTLSDKRSYKKGGTVVAEEKPPLIRNKDIVNDSQILIATPAGSQEELRSGTWATVRYARRIGKPVRIIWPDGTIDQEDE